MVIWWLCNWFYGDNIDNMDFLVFDYNTIFGFFIRSIVFIWRCFLEFNEGLKSPYLSWICIKTYYFIYYYLVIGGFCNWKFKISWIVVWNLKLGHAFWLYGKNEVFEIFHFYFCLIWFLVFRNLKIFNLNYGKLLCYSWEKLIILVI